MITKQPSIMNSSYKLGCRVVPSFCVRIPTIESLSTISSNGRHQGWGELFHSLGHGDVLNERNAKEWTTPVIRGGDPRPRNDGPRSSHHATHFSGIFNSESTCTHTLSLTPSQSWVVNVTSTRLYTLNHSGWWSIFSANNAVRDMKDHAWLKSAK